MQGIMTKLSALIDKNRAWSRRMRETDAQFFERLSQQQAPKYLWIGCSDSRVPANQIIDMAPGEVFVHRNVANVVVHADLNCLSTIQFAVDVLKVEQVMVVGHYGCGGVHAALTGARLGLIDNWLRHVADVAQKHRDVLAPIGSETARHARLCELNALEQAVNVCQTTIVQDAWQRRQPLSVHAWVYGLQDGQISDLGLDMSSTAILQERYSEALANLGGK
jgi:carbonic anhydrase